MTDRADVAITAAKGRPMLVWVGKRPLRRVTAFPAQHVETFEPTGSLRAAPPDARWADWPDRYPRGGLLFHGDNKEVLAHLLANGFRGKVKLVYIDPPFDSGADYVRRVLLRGASGSVRVGGEAYTLGEQVQYTDIWANDGYLQFMYERLQLLRELLADDGYLYLHLDSNRVHYLRVVADEVFGEGSFVNEIIWQQTSAHNDPGRFGKVHHNILLYRKSDQGQLNTKLGVRSRRYIENWFKYALSPTGEVVNLQKGEAPPPGYRRFRLSDLRSPHPRPNLQYSYKGYRPHPNGWAVAPERMEQYDRENRLHYPSSPEGRIQLRNFLDDMDAAALQDMWWDLVAECDEDELDRLEVVSDTWRGAKTLQGNSRESVGYPTQKPETLVTRILETSSDAGDIVLDCFIGSGTAAAVAQRLGRRWIGCDINKGAIQTTSRRLQTIIAEQAAERADPVQGALLAGGDEGDEDTPPPAQLAFTVWRVNDYDLQIQHNEAVALACEHLGVARTRADAYFDGLLGNRLVKIVPFTHPLTLLDLEELKRELAARPDEPRDVVLVCLGKESAADAWLDHWNRLRTQNGIPNRIDVVELRTDPKVGGFFSHQPATARVDVRRQGDRLVVEVLDFISPTIVQRLKDQAGILAPHIEDWRSMVDTIMIDTAYDGQVFDIVLSDVPEKKDDLVAGRYDLPAPQGATTVAVKLIDMLGEEVLVTRQV